MPNPGQIKPFRAEAAILKRRIVKAGTADTGVVHATTTTESLIGITTEVDTDSGDVCDVIQSGTASLVLGGTVAYGDRITSGAAGVGVKCNPSTGVAAQYIGKAMQAGVSGDIIDVHIEPGQQTTP